MYKHLWLNKFLVRSWFKETNHYLIFHSTKKSMYSHYTQTFNDCSFRNCTYICDNFPVLEF